MMKLIPEKHQGRSNPTHIPGSALTLNAEAPPQHVQKLTPARSQGCERLTAAFQRQLPPSASIHHPLSRSTLMTSTTNKNHVDDDNSDNNCGAKCLPLKREREP